MITSSLGPLKSICWFAHSFIHSVIHLMSSLPPISEDNCCDSQTHSWETFCTNSPVSQVGRVRLEARLSSAPYMSGARISPVGLQGQPLYLTTASSSMSGTSS